MLVEESVLGFSLRCLRPKVFEFQLGRVLGQRIRKHAHARSLATVRHLSGPCCSAIHPSDRSTAMHVPFTKPRKCTSILKSPCEARFGLPDAARPSAKTTSPSPTAKSRNSRITGTGAEASAQSEVIAPARPTRPSRPVARAACLHL